MFDHKKGISFSVVILVFVAGLLVGFLAAIYFTYDQINALKTDVSGLKTDFSIAEGQLSAISGNQTVFIENGTIVVNGSVVYSQLYDKVKDSVVLITGTISGSEIVQGSGFVYDLNGSMVVVTNNHVVAGTSAVNVAFSDGDAYAAVVNGTDPYSDLAVLTLMGVNQSEFKPLQIVDSSTLNVGDPVVAVGNPYGLTGSMTTGVVSALGRTITEENYSGLYPIANIIQTSAPINPGNSGGPLLNLNGSVVGITAAIVENSQGVGFAVDSNTVLREVYALATYGKYTAHSYLGVSGLDMDYILAKSMGVKVTYGWAIQSVVAGGPADKGKVKVNDVIVAINGTKMVNGDQMTSYIDANTLPSQTVDLTVVRGNSTLTLPVVLGTRPSSTS